MIKQADILSFYEDERGKLLLGTFAAGIKIWQKKGSRNRISETIENIGGAYRAMFLSQLFQSSTFVTTWHMYANHLRHYANNLMKFHNRFTISNKLLKWITKLLLSSNSIRDALSLGENQHSAIHHWQYLQE